MNYIDRIEKMRACPEAIAWLRERNYPTLQEAWDNCKRGDWMLWLLPHTGWAATNAAAYAADRAAAAVAAAYEAAAAYAATRAATYEKQAEIVRKYFPVAPALEGV